MTSDAMVSASTLPRVFRHIAMGLGIALLGIATGWAITHQGRLSILYLAVCVIAALLLLFGQLRLSVIWVWAPLSVAAYALVREFPIVTFDRLWVGAMAGLLVLLPRTRAPSRATRRVLFWFALLAATFGLRAALTSEMRVTALSIWVDAVVLPLILFAVVRVAVTLNDTTIDRISLSLVIAGLVLALIGIAEWVFGFSLASATGGTPRLEAPGVVRISGPFRVPEPFALSLTICFASTVYWIQSRRGSAALAGMLVAALELIAIGFTLFRVAWVAAVVVGVVALGLRPRRFARGLRIGGMIGLVLLLGFTGFQRIPLLATRLHESESFYGRLASYKQGLQLFAEQPLVGVGVNRYFDAASQLSPTAVRGVYSEPYAHSSFEGLLAEQGLIGFVVLLALAVAVWRMAREFNRRCVSRLDALLAACASGAMLAYLLFSLTLTMLPYGPSNAFFAVILGMVAGRLDRQGEAHRSSQAQTATAAPAVRGPLANVSP
jgi:O-antigen ligase